jgi:hypothetical protein
MKKHMIKRICFTDLRQRRELFGLFNRRFRH